MKEITNHHLGFLNESIRAFREFPYLSTWRNKDDSLIALRTGEGRESILIYEIKEVAYFKDQLPEAPPLVLLEEEL